MEKNPAGRSACRRQDRACRSGARGRRRRTIPRGAHLRGHCWRTPIPRKARPASGGKGQQDARGAARGSVVRQEPGRRAAVGLRRILQPHQAAHGTERRRHARKGGRHHKGANLRAARIGNAYWQGQAASGHATPRLLRPLPQGDPVCLVPAPPCGGDPGGRREGVARTVSWCTMPGRRPGKTTRLAQQAALLSLVLGRRPARRY